MGRSGSRGVSRRRAHRGAAVGSSGHRLLRAVRLGNRLALLVRLCRCLRPRGTTQTRPAELGARRHRGGGGGEFHRCGRPGRRQPEWSSVALSGKASRWLSRQSHPPGGAPARGLGTHRSTGVAREGSAVVVAGRPLDCCRARVDPRTRGAPHRCRHRRRGTCLLRRAPGGAVRPAHSGRLRHRLRLGRVRARLTGGVGNLDDHVRDSLQHLETGAGGSRSPPPRWCRPRRGHLGHRPARECELCRPPRPRDAPVRLARLRHRGRRHHRAARSGGILHVVGRCRPQVAWAVSRLRHGDAGGRADRAHQRRHHARGAAGPRRGHRGDRRAAGGSRCTLELAASSAARNVGIRSRRRSACVGRSA